MKEYWDVVSVHDVYHPHSGELLVKSGEEITETIAQAIEDSPIERVEVRSVLTCESKKGVCAKCYGRNWQPDVWLRWVKLLEPLQHSLLVSLVLS